MCECKFHNGDPIQACRPLCQSGESPKCESNSQTIEEYQDPVNGTSCMCTKKKCVSGMILFPIYCFQMVYAIHQGVLTKGKWDIV